MSVSLDSSDGLLRHVLVGGFISNSPIPHHGNESKQSEDRLYSNNLNHSTPLVSSSLLSASPTFSLPTFSPLKLSHLASPISSPSKSGARVSPTNWVPQHRHSRSSFSSSSFSSPRGRAMSPVLNLAKIDETKELKTPLYKAETPDHEMNMNVPSMIITTATPQDDNNNPDNNNSFHCHTINQFSHMRSLDDVSLRLRTLSVSPVLERSSGLIVSSGDDGHKRYLKFRRSDITFGKIIGKGGFGCVHEGNIAGSPVAVKIVQKRRGSGIHREILQAERLAFKLNLSHENIVGIYGVNLCEELRGDALILMELMTSQSLQALLEDTPTDIPAEERLGYALQVARGLKYLHDNNLAHLDVKPANVLMTSDHVCKLSDFGNLTLTGPRVRQEEPEFTQLLGTLPYRAPELMNGIFPSTKADIYSFGITLWQMLTRESPHKSANPHALIYQVVKWDIRPSMPDTGNDVIEKMYLELYTSCWSRDMDQRPDAYQIIDTIQNITQEIST